MSEDQKINPGFGSWTMLRISALRAFQREYYHGLRNNLTPEQSADRALTRIKVQVLKELDEQYPKDLLTRNEKWGDILGVLIEWQILLKDIPLDPARLNEIPPKESTPDPLAELHNHHQDP